MKIFLDREGIEHFNKVCSNTKASIYTDPEGDICPNGGWLEIMYDECKEKCIRNEIPDGCEIDKPPGGCAFAVFTGTSPWDYPGKCRLANSHCIMDDGNYEEMYIADWIWENPKRRK